MAGIQSRMSDQHGGKSIHTLLVFRVGDIYERPTTGPTIHTKSAPSLPGASTARSRCDSKSASAGFWVRPQCRMPHAGRCYI